MDIQKQIQIKKEEAEQLEGRLRLLRKEISELEEKLTNDSPQNSAFDFTLKGILSVPKPPKEEK